MPRTGRRASRAGSVAGTRRAIPLPSGRSAPSLSQLGERVRDCIVAVQSCDRRYENDPRVRTKEGPLLRSCPQGLPTALRACSSRPHEDGSTDDSRSDESVRPVTNPKCDSIAARCSAGTRARSRRRDQRTADDCLISRSVVSRTAVSRTRDMAGGSVGRRPQFVGARDREHPTPGAGSIVSPDVCL